MTFSSTLRSASFTLEIYPEPQKTLIERFVIRQTPGVPILSSICRSCSSLTEYVNIEKQEAEEAIAYGMDATKFFTIRHAPISLIYKPSADTIQTLEHKDFLGQRQVIAVNSNQTPPPSNMTRSRTVDSGLTRNRSSPNPTSITAPPIRTVLNKFNSPQSVIPQRGSSAHSIASQAQRSRSHSAGSASRPAHLDSAGSDPALNTPLSAVTPRRPSNGPSRTGPSPSSRPNYDPFASPDSTDPFSPNYPSSVLSSPSNYARRGSSLGRVTPNAEGPPTPRKGSLLSQPVSELDVADSVYFFHCSSILFQTLTK